MEAQMKKIIVLGLMSLLFAAGMRTQEHAPTVDVCRADRAAWDSSWERADYFDQEAKHANDGTDNTNPIATLPFEEISLRLREMGTCMKVDRQNLNKYYEMGGFYSEEKR